MNIATSAINATANTRRVDKPFPAACQESVAAIAIAIVNSEGMSQSVPRIKPIASAIGRCNHSMTSNALLVDSRNAANSSFSTFIPHPPD